MTHLSLFSGIGGLDLAAEWAGFDTVGQCEWADYPTRVLEKHWPDVPRWRDIRTLTKESFFEKTGLRTVDVVSGGFPCQPFSVAGKQEGKDDDRYLWPEMRRVIAELAPRWVVGENVPGILRIAASDVVQDLERLGFNVVVFEFEAAAVGAPHRRDRIAFVAYFNSRTMRNDSNNKRETNGEKHASIDAGNACGKIIPDSKSGGVSRELPSWIKAWRSCGTNRWAAEPGVGRVAHGIPARMDRLKCLGNAVVPKQFFPIFNAIYETEMEDANGHQTD